MPKDSLSARDRLRLAELMRSPLLGPRVPAKSLKETNQWRCRIEAGLQRARHKLSAWWDARGAALVRRHLAEHWRAWSAGAAALVVCLVVLGNAVKMENRRGESVQLQALDQLGQLEIRWDPESDLVRRATGAKLFIIDGSQRLYVRLNGARLRRGSVNYSRRSDRVDLRLALAQPDGRLVEQQATFVGTRPANADSSQWLAAAKQGPGSLQTPGVPAPAAQVVETPTRAILAEHRARRKSPIPSGPLLPFTCSTGDVFHKTDAPQGWNIFSCRGKNVWGLKKDQAREDRPASKPSAKATRLTEKPATTSTT